MRGKLETTVTLPLHLSASKVFDIIRKIPRDSTLTEINIISRQNERDNPATEETAVLTFTFEGEDE